MCALRNVRGLLNIKSLCLVNFEHSRGLKHWQMDVLRVMYWRSRAMEYEPPKLRHRNAWRNWNYKAELFAFNQRLHENFPEDILRTAFTDKSYLVEEERKRVELGFPTADLVVEHNERLSLLGTEKMSSFLKSYLRYFLPRLPEDGVKAVADYTLSDDVLADIGSKIGCSDLIMCTDLPITQPTVARCVKALVGALIESNGEKHAEKFILDFVCTYLHTKDILEIWNITLPEQRLKQILLNDNRPEPEPRLLRETGRNTILACYVVGLYDENKKLLGFGPGENISIAREMAAYDALRRLFKLRSSDFLFRYGQKAYEINFNEYSVEHLSLEQWRCSSSDLPSSETKQRIVTY